MKFPKNAKKYENLPKNAHFEILEIFLKIFNFFFFEFSSSRNNMSFCSNNCWNDGSFSGLRTAAHGSRRHVIFVNPNNITCHLGQMTERNPFIRHVVFAQNCKTTCCFSSNNNNLLHMKRPVVFAKNNKNDISYGIVFNL